MFTLHHQVLSPLLSIVSPTPLPDHQKRKGKLRQQTENYVSCIRLDPENKTKKRQKKNRFQDYMQMLTKIPGPLSQCCLQMLTPSLYWKMTLSLWKASFKCNQIDPLRLGVEQRRNRKLNQKPKFRFLDQTFGFGRFRFL